MLRYTVLLYPEPEEGGYSVLVPLLGVATQGDTIDEALAHARELIDFQVSALEAEGEHIPIEEVTPIIAAVEVPRREPAATAPA